MLQRPGRPLPQAGAVGDLPAVRRPRSSARSSSGAPTSSALSWPIAATRARVALRRVVSSTRSASRSPRRRGWPGGRGRAPRGRPGPRPARRSWRRCAGLAAWVGRPRRPAHRAAAGTRPGRRRSCPPPRPPSSDGQAAGAWAKSEQPPVAGGVGAGGGLGQHAAQAGDGGGGQGVAVGVDADDAVDRSASMAMRWSSWCGGRPWSVSAWEESPRGRTVMGHNPCRLDRLLIRPAWWARPTPAPRQTARAEGNPPGCQLHNESCRGAERQSLTAILPDRRPTLTVAQRPGALGWSSPSVTLPRRRPASVVVTMLSRVAGAEESCMPRAPWR